MSIMSLGRPVGKYLEIGGEWVHAFHLPALNGSETMTIQTGGFTWKYVRVGDEWVHAAALVDETGDPVSLSTMSLNLLPYVQTVPPNALTTAQVWTSANAAVLHRVRVSAPMTVSKMIYPIGTASGNVDLGIYTSVDGGENLTRVASSGSTAAAGATTVHEVTLTAPYELMPGVDYWLAMAADNTTLTTVRSAGPNASTMGYLRMSVLKSSAFPLPATIASPAASNLLLWFAAVP